MVREFHAAITGQRLTEPVRQLLDLRAESRYHDLAVLARDFHKHCKPGMRLDEHRNVGITSSGNQGHL